MKKITIDIIRGFISDQSIPLLPTQSILCIPVINRIYFKMANGLKFPDIKVCGNLLIDGHHRYVSSLLAKTSIEIQQSQKTSATKLFSWAEIEFTTNEWDTEDKIEKLNREDAAFNGIPLAKIYEMANNLVILPHVNFS